MDFAFDVPLLRLSLPCKGREAPRGGAGWGLLSIAIAPTRPLAIARVNPPPQAGEGSEGLAR